MILIKYLATTIFGLLGIIGFLGNIYISLSMMFKSPEEREQLGWMIMIIMTLSSFMMCLIWMIWEPLARTAVSPFVTGCVVIGLFFRESAISPYKLANFWKRIGTKRSEKKEEVTHKNQ